MKLESKKALKDNYKNHEIIGGVYRIVCSGNDRYWLESAKEIKTAKNRFLFSKSSNSCPKMSMQKEWKLYGSGAFSFEILEEIKKEELLTDLEFNEELSMLLELWKDKLEGTR